MEIVVQMMKIPTEGSSPRNMLQCRLLIILYPEVRGSRVLLILGTSLPNYTVSQPR